ncbi:ABC transporter permease [Oceanivirga salmonicida]|uniref:ABC transporter permease n=1 Tax=Oceanivirga salmonicida TaxID=1769291 RepID=UPI00082C277A|nr:iron ABC transporter permease [Oceanivirga salmonicida]
MANEEFKKIKEKKGFIVDIKNIYRDPSLAFLLAVVFLFFIIIIVYPFVKLSLIPSKNIWIEAITNKFVLKVFRNTIISSLSATFLATIFGFLFAYAMNYTNIPGKSIFRVISLLPNMAPSIMTGLAFIMLFGRRGIITYKLLGLRIDPYGPIGLLIVQTIAFFPLAYITISGVLKSISPNVELSAQNLGASGFRLFRTVTLPLATPGIASAFLLVFINAIADFGNPLLIGGNYKTLATLAYDTVIGNFDIPMAAALSLFLLLPSLIIFLIQKYYLDKKSFVTITGKPTSGLERNFVSFGAKLMLFIFSFIMCFVILLIVGSVMAFSITEAFGVNYTFTTRHLYEGIINSYPIRNSWLFAMTAALITSVVGVILAFLNVRKKFPGRGIIDFLAMLPISLPGTFIGLALVISFNKKPLFLTGTAAIVIIGMVIRQIPVGYRNSVAGFKQIDKSIEEAATNLGSSSIGVFKNVILPMLKNQISITFVYSFMKGMNTLSTIIFLISPKTQLASAQILSLSEHGFYGVASATALGMMLIILLTFGLFKLILRDNINIFNL